MADVHSEIESYLEERRSRLDDRGFPLVDEHHRGHQNLGAFLTDEISTSHGAHLRFPVSPDEELWPARTFVPEQFFGRHAPLEIELGTGKARFLIEAARAQVAHDFLGIERSLSYYRFSRRRIARSGLANARVVRADARLFVTGSLAPESVRAFHAYFPDPWPKKRQKKRRLLDGVFLETLARRLEPGGFLRIATDHLAYAHEIASVLQTVPMLEELEWNAHPTPPPSHYEIKYGAEGRRIRRFLLRKTRDGKRETNE